MSKYTTEVRWVVETFAEPTAKTINEKIDSALPKIFDFNFPIFSENHRAELEHKIIKHYYTREIGFETVGLWKLNLDRMLNEIMPYYNELYKSAALEYNIEDEYLELDIFSGVNTSLSTDNSQTTSTSNSIDRDFPQASYTPNTGDYATASAENETSGQGTNSTDVSATNDYTSTKKGRHKSVPELIEDYRRVIINIDLKIIEDLNKLFMLIY